MFQDLYPLSFAMQGACADKAEYSPHLTSIRLKLVDINRY
jgi:hypothetical protein